MTVRMRSISRPGSGRSQEPSANGPSRNPTTARWRISLDIERRETGESCWFNGRRFQMPRALVQTPGNPKSILMASSNVFNDTAGPRKLLCRK